MTKYNAFLLLLLSLSACHSSHKISAPLGKPMLQDTQTIPEVRIYRASNTLTNSIINTRLELDFDWSKKQLHGKATISLTPYFYPVSKLILNARGMALHEVSLIKGTEKIPLTYTYIQDTINITLDKSYKKNEPYEVFIDYTSKPEDLKTSGSSAILSDKGLYFINADGKEKDKPQQIWTQGETQSNSVWFPTIDSPNEKMTQEIYMKVDTGFTTLSNGLLISSTNNHDGTKTDYWKQSLPAAPYLSMIAIGKYAVVKDTWKNIEVNYYVEPEYEPYARLIFGHTPEMISFFSKKLGVDYPWEKFAQIVVRDYVSGAMENTTAVVHGEFLQQNSREYLDNTYEDIVAHELFHHWFGDLVTCESWSNIPLNESFATYGVYLWNENKYGREEADYGLQQDANEYLAMEHAKEVNLIRYNYESCEDLFDVVSYEKGGRVLHMLRKTVGDEAFFSALKLYLQTNKFKTVEVANLRLAFEEVTGEDLNWFFNEWFFNSGQPDLKISYSYIDSTQTQYIYTEQNQPLATSPVYTLPVSVDVYGPDGNPVRYDVTLKNLKDTFAFKVSEKPLLVNFDSEKMLLAVKNDLHTSAEWLYMLNHAPLYLDRYEAITKLCKNYSPESPQVPAIISALKDKQWNIRALAVKNCGTLAESAQYKDVIKTELIGLIQHDIKSDVRVAALRSLSKYYTNDSLNEVYKKSAGDSSYNVMGEALSIYFERNSKTGIAWLKQFENVKSTHIESIISGIYAEQGDDDNDAYFVRSLENARGFGKYHLVSAYSKFLGRCHPKTIETGISLIEDVARNATTWWVRLSGTQALAEVQKSCEEKSSGLEREIKEGNNTNKPGIEIQSLENEKKRYDDLQSKIDTTIKDIKKHESDESLKKIYHSDKN